MEKNKITDTDELLEDVVSANEFTGALQSKPTSEEEILYYHRLFNQRKK